MSKEIQLDLPPDIALQQAQEARANSIINSMAFEIFSNNVKNGMGALELEGLVDTSFLAVRTFINKAGM